VTTRQPRRRRQPLNRSTALAEAWAWELAAAGLIERTRPEIELLLRAPIERLETVLSADPFRPSDAATVGAYLVELGATSPDALRRSYLLLVRRLRPGDRLPEEAGRDRVHRVLAEIMAGFVQAQHAATLRAQERLGAAVRTAREGAKNPGTGEPAAPSDRHSADPTASPWFEH
jgi:diguanylate cyclase